MECHACGRRIFSSGLRTCPDCQVSLAGHDSNDPAYAREPPPHVEPAGDEDLSRVELPHIPRRWLVAGGAVLALLLVVPCASDGLAWVRTEQAHRAQAEADRKEAEAAKRWCAERCPDGVLKVSIDGDCSGINVGMAKRNLARNHCNCRIETTSLYGSGS